MNEKSKERRLRHGVIWAVVSIALVVGAALVASPNSSHQVWGVTLIASPLLAFGLLAAVYYFLERRG